ncbi:substrate-binding domain-containing protein [Pelagibius sp.]|uniref:substrate-binding domain-containing protein n=1 Tax=Pelagibius sp. TaxID=1931238 RepID=UPI003B50D985
MKQLVLAAAAATVFFGAQAEGRDTIRILSSEASFPYTAMVGESFASNYRQPTPIIERTTARSSTRSFCAGVGREFPDIIGIPRRMWDAEFKECRDNGVDRITEIKVGYDGIVLVGAPGGPVIRPTKAQIFQALAKRLVIDGELVDNPHTRWNQIHDSLPDMPIRVVGPLVNTDPSNAFLLEVMDTGCRKIETMARLPEEVRDPACVSLRNDTAFASVSKSYDEAVRMVRSRDHQLAIMPFSFYETHADSLAVHPIDGVLPDEQSIALGDYPVICTLFVYVKVQHYEQVPGILEFVTEYTSDRAWGPDGYLVDLGMIPMSHRERIDQRANAIGLNPMWR